MCEDDDEAQAIAARIAAAGFIVCCDDRPPPGVRDRWLAAALPSADAPPGSADVAATGATRLEALRALERRLGM